MRKQLLIAATLLLSVVAKGAEKTDSLSVNLQEAIEIALSENPTIKIANTEIERQTYVRRETNGHLLPSLSASGQYMYNIMNPVMFMPEGIFGPGTGGAMQMGFSNSFNAGLNLSLPLVAPTLWATMKLNEDMMKEAVEKARSSKIDLAASVKKSYYALLLTRSSLQLIEENIALAEEVVANNEAAFKQGIVSEYDLITSQVQLSNLNPSLIEAENAQHNARLLLNMLLGLPKETPLKVKENLLDFVNFINQENNYEINLANNSSLNLLEIQQDMLNNQLKLQKTTRMPTLAAFGQYSLVSQNNTFNFGEYDWRQSAFIGLQLDIPIFTGLSNINKEKQIKNQQEQLEMQKGYLAESISVEAEAAISNIKSAEKQMAANLTAKEQAAKGYSISVTRYETGVGTVVEVNQAQLQLIQADMSYRQSIYNYMVAQADYDKAVGSDF